MTRAILRPYHFRLKSLERPIFRIVLIAPAALALACASGTATQKDTAELREELKAMRAKNELLEGRVARLEQEQSVHSAARAAAKASGREQPWTPSSVPELTVVKLRPRENAPPPLATATVVQEPSPLAVAAPPDEEEDAEDAPAPVDPAEAERAFEEAMGALKTGNVSGSVLKLQTFATSNPRHARSDNALYFSGVGLMSLEDWAGAAGAFERVLNEYPAGDARIDALLKLADCRLKQNQKDDARALYARLISTYPGTSAATVATERLSRITQ